MIVTQTPRLTLRELEVADADFILALLNDADFVSRIGDRGVRTHEDAVAYLESGPRASYGTHGFGLWAVEVRGSGAVAGICGLLKRDALDAPDIGFAFLPAHRGYGYATEAARASAAYGRERCGVTRLLAVVQPGNDASVRVLDKLGLTLDGRVRLADDGPELLVYASGATTSS